MSKRDPIRTDWLTLPKGLTKEAALRLAEKKLKKDFRAFTYNPKTGKSSMT